MAALEPLPAQAAWRHHGAREGFEVAHPQRSDDGGCRLRGATTAVEAGLGWTVRYDVSTAPGWTTRAAVVRIGDAAGEREVRLARDAAGGWRVDGVARPDLDGVVDVDLEASLVTNTLPLRRLVLDARLVLGETVSAPAAFVRLDGTVTRLDQGYALLGTGDGGLTVDYRCPTFDLVLVLRLDPAGLVLDYPGLGVRHP